MENEIHGDTPAPANCFQLSEVEQLRSFEGQALAGINYYLWLDVAETAGERPYRFLFALELIFDSGAVLLLSSGDDSEAIRIITPAALVETASRLQQLHGQPTIQRLARDGQGVWQGAMGQPLAAIQLTRHEGGLYLNDALMLDFGTVGIVVELPEAGEGLEIREV